MVLAALLGSGAFACAVCQDPTDVRAGVYFDMTIFMSLLPVISMAVGGLWLWHRSRDPVGA